MPNDENQAERMTLKAIQEDPWAAVQLPLPPDASRTLLVAAARAAKQCRAEAQRIVRNHDREDAESVGYAAEMRFMGEKASERISEIYDRDPSATLVGGLSAITRKPIRLTPATTLIPLPPKSKTRPPHP
jgi:hypothetical protein